MPTPRGRGALPDVASVKIQGNFTSCPVAASWPYLAYLYAACMLPAEF
jgi:hypothetical protein